MSDEEIRKDFVKIAIDYAREASDIKNKKRFGIWIRLAAIRFLNDLKRENTEGCSFYFSDWHANDVCDFAEKLPHVEGVWETPTIVLHRSHIFFLVQLFGFRNSATGTRRYTTALFAIARKNAKSTLASIIGLYCQNCEGEIGPQVVTGATTGQQARIVFNVAKRMVEKTNDLREAFALTPFANSIASFLNGGSFKPINAKASTQDGLNPSCTILDEIHAHQNSDLLNVLKSAAGARKNPLFLYLTTEGYSNPGPWQEEREFAKKVLRGIIEADHYLAIYYAVDEKDEELKTDSDDDFDESCWIKANPLMEVNPLLLDEIRKSAIEAKDKPSQHSEFKIKRLNRPSSVSQGFINLTKWRECKGKIDIEFLKKYKCYGGLDLSSTGDLTSFRLKWDIDGIMYTVGRRWVPSIAVRKRTTRGLVPYQGWIDRGFLIPAGNEAIDYAEVEAKIIELSQIFMIEGIAYDSWNATQTVQRLNDAGLNMIQFIQGPKSFHPAMQALEVAYLGENFVHGDDPVLNWNASNLVARQDANLNNAPDKKKSTEKIDDMVALLMAIGVSIKSDLEPKPTHQLFFV